jgi:hypothetical protein
MKIFKITSETGELAVVTRTLVSECFILNLISQRTNCLENHSYVLVYERFLSDKPLSEI